MPEISNDLLDILQWIGLSAAVLVVLSLISFYWLRLASNDLTDETGWQNFAKPFIGMSIFIVTILFVILIVFILLGVI